MNTNNITTEMYLNLLKKVLTASIYEESDWQVKRPSGNRRIKNVFLRYFMKKSFLLIKVKKFDEVARENGIDQPMFGYTMVGLRRLDNVTEYLEKNSIQPEIKEIDGSAVYWKKS